LGFSIVISKHTGNEIEFLVDFENPEEVSKEVDWDFIRVDLKYPKLHFRGSKSFNTFDLKCLEC